MRINTKNIINNVKVDDSKILAGEPIVLIKYGKKYTIRQLNYLKEFPKYREYLFNFLQYYNNVCDVLDLPDSVADIEMFKRSFSIAIGQHEKKIVKKILSNMLKMFSFFGNKNHIKKYFTLDDYIELFLYAYYYNIKSVKKNLTDVFEMIKRT